MAGDCEFFWDYDVCPAVHVMENLFVGLHLPLNNPNYHDSTDTIDTFNMKFYKNMAKLAIASTAQIAMNGVVASVEEKPENNVNAFRLNQNYPNPFNPETTIHYDLPVDTEVELVIFNVLGQKVRTLVDKKEKAGEKSIPWDGRDDGGLPLGSGTYLIRMRSGDFLEVKKMVLLR
jgi:hypothetical protein